MTEEFQQLSFDDALEKVQTSRRMLDNLFASIRHFKTTRDFFELMAFIGRFTNYSPFNCALLYIQNPNVTYVATASQWRKKHHREVMPEARPLLILAPMRPVMFVYDLVDTTGRPVPEYILHPFQVSGEIEKDIYLRILQNARAMGIGIGMETNLSTAHAGSAWRLPVPMKFTFTDSHGIKVGPISISIDINESLDIPSRVDTAAHELAHIFCGHLGKVGKEPWPERKCLSGLTCEFEAESVAYLICSRLGITNHSVEYLSVKAAENIMLPPVSFDAIFFAVNEIEQMGRSLSPRAIEILQDLGYQPSKFRS